jgi:hypothetical protein
MQPSFRIASTPKARIITIEVVTPLQFGKPLLGALQRLSATSQGKVRHQPLSAPAGTDKRGTHRFRLNPRNLKPFVTMLTEHNFKNSF